MNDIASLQFPADRPHRELRTALCRAMCIDMATFIKAQIVQYGMLCEDGGDFLHDAHSMYSWVHLINDDIADHKPDHIVWKNLKYVFHHDTMAMLLTYCKLTNTTFSS